MRLRGAACRSEEGGWLRMLWAESGKLLVTVVMDVPQAFLPGEVELGPEQRQLLPRWPCCPVEVACEAKPGEGWGEGDSKAMSFSKDAPPVHKILPRVPCPVLKCCVPLKATG